MKAIIKEAGELCRETDIPNALKALQNLVGGYIETTNSPIPYTTLIVNDEGKMNGSKANIIMRDDDGNLIDVLFGTIIAVGVDGDNFTDLTPSQCNELCFWLNGYSVMV